MVSEKTVETFIALIESRLRCPATKFIGPPVQQNPVRVMYRIQELLEDIDSLTRQESLGDAAGAIARGCTWRDYKGKGRGWAK